MSILTIDSVEYPVQRVDAAHEHVDRKRRAFSGKMRSSLTNDAGTAVMRRWRIRSDYLSAAEADAIEALATTEGTFSIAGDSPGGTVAVRAQNYRRLEQPSDLVIVEFDALEEF